MLKLFSVFAAAFHDPEKGYAILNVLPERTGSFSFVYLLPLIVAGAAGRMMQQMRQVPEGGFSDFQLMLIGLLSYGMAAWLGALMLYQLAPAFKSRADFSKTLYLTGFALTPYLVFQLVIGFVPALSWLSFLSLAYTVYLFWRGLETLLHTPPTKQSSYSLTAFFVLFGIAYVVILFFRAFFIANP